MKQKLKDAKKGKVFRCRKGDAFIYQSKTDTGHWLIKMNRSKFTDLFVDDNGIADRDMFSSDYDIVGTIYD